MSLKKQFSRRFISKETLGPDILRLAVCLISFTHGFHRFQTHEVSGLAGVLAEQKVPFGLLAACLVTLAETLGMALLALRLMVWPVTFIVSGIYFTGILMFNIHKGFFVVGAGEGGWEYNALLVTCLLVTAWHNRANRVW